jgi:hypothetical protein
VPGLSHTQAGHDGHAAEQLQELEQLEPAWPALTDLSWEALLERTRADFQLLRRMLL